VDIPIAFLQDLVVLFVLAIVVVIACVRVRLPPIVGFLITGVLAGPGGLGLIADVHSVEVLSEIGVVLLLFAIGLEFSLESLLRLRSTLFVGGGLQVLITVLLIGGASAVFLHLPFAKATFLGILVALSSTAIALKLFADSAEVDSPQGRVSLSILIFQDLCVVPIVIVMPILAGKGTKIGEVAESLTRAAVMLAVAVGGGRYLVPWVLGQVVRTRSREAFLLGIIILCLGTAWLSQVAGLSLALGAFIAGLVVSQSQYSHQALGEIIPFRDTFSSLFLISIGMLLDLRSLASHPAPLIIGVIVLLLLKAIVAWGVTLYLGYAFRVAVIVGMTLAQVGEFSFVIAKHGAKDGLIDAQVYQLFLATAVLTMLLTPFLKRLAPWVADKLLPFVPQRLKALRAPGCAAEETNALDSHVIIIGYGLNGRNLAFALQRVSIPYVVIEMNPETVASERKKGQPILYGDASSPEIMIHAGIQRARVLVIAVSDPSVIRRATDLARRLNPGLHVIVRTRYLQEMRPLLELGADEVVPEEFETSIEIFSRTLRKLLVPRDVVERFVREIRTNGYGALRRDEAAKDEPQDSGSSEDRFASLLGGADMEVLRVEPGSPLAGKTIESSSLRRLTGATILALRRGEELLSNPPAATTLDPGLVAIVFGTPEQVSRAAALFRPPESDPKVPDAATRPPAEAERDSVRT